MKYVVDMILEVDLDLLMWVLYVCDDPLEGRTGSSLSETSHWFQTLTVIKHVFPQCITMETDALKQVYSRVIVQHRHNKNKYMCSGTPLYKHVAIYDIVAHTIPNVFTWLCLCPFYTLLLHFILYILYPSNAEALVFRKRRISIYVVDNAW